MTRSAVATVSFDLDGTLISGPFGGVIGEAASLIAAEASAAGSVPIDAEQVRAEVRRVHQARLDRGEAAAYDWADVLVEVSAHFGVDVPLDLDAMLARRAPTRTRLLDPDTLTLLGSLRRQRMRVLIITNGYRRYQLPAIRAVGLDTVIDGLVTADDVAAAKPDPAIFAHAYGDTPGARIHIGDRLDHDVAGAHRGGATSVLLTAMPPSDSPWSPAGASRSSSTAPTPHAVATTLAAAVDHAVALAGTGSGR